MKYLKLKKITNDKSQIADLIEECVEKGIKLFAYTTAICGDTSVKHTPFAKNKHTFNYPLDTMLADYLEKSYCEISVDVLEEILHDEMKSFGVVGGVFNTVDGTEVMNIYPHTCIFYSENGYSGFPYVKNENRRPSDTPEYLLEDLCIKKEDQSRLEQTRASKETKIIKKPETKQEDYIYPESVKGDNLRKTHEAAIDLLINLISEDAKKGFIKESAQLNKYLTEDGSFKLLPFAEELTKDSKLYFDNEKGFSSSTIRARLSEVLSKFE